MIVYTASVTDVEGTQVAHQEFVATLKDMLEAAAIPVSLDVQEMMEAKLKVDEELRNARKRLADAEKVCFTRLNLSGFEI